MSNPNNQLLLYQIILALLQVLNSQSSGTIDEKVKKTRLEIDEEMAKLNS